MIVMFVASLHAAPDPNWLGHDRERPLPAVVDPGTASTQDQPGVPPSDATVLFDGANGKRPLNPMQILAMSYRGEVVA
jgi:hypothetical protein